MKKNFITLLIGLLLCSHVNSQSCTNYFNEIEVSPAICGEDNGTITVESSSINIDYTWDDGSTELVRENLAKGLYTLTGVDEKGCEESVTLNVPDISDCDLEIKIDYPFLPPPDGETSGRVRPCLFLSFEFTLNGEVVPNEFLSFFWTVTEPIPIFPFSYSYTSYAPSIAIYAYGATATLDVSLNSEYGQIDCCSFLEEINITDPCPHNVLPPRVFVYKSTFRDENSKPNVPGLVDLIVYGDGNCGGTTDLRGFIIDDNNGELISSAPDEFLDSGSGLNVDLGYLSFTEDDLWAAVPNGSIITIFESEHSMNEYLLELEDPMDSNQDFHYIISAENSDFLKGHHALWDIETQMTNYGGEGINPVWDLIEASGEAGAMQVRYPDGNYCHGVSFGGTDVSAEYNWFPLHITENQYAYCQIHMNQFSDQDKSAFESLEVTGGFTPGAIFSPEILAVVGQLRDCGYEGALMEIPGLDEEKITQARSGEPADEVVTASATSKSSLNVFPSPFEQFLNVEFQSEVTGIGLIQVYNSQGMLVQTIETNCTRELQNYKLDFGPNTNSGLFFIQFQYPDSSTKTVKAVLMSND